MSVESFFAYYANMPLADRLSVASQKYFGPATWDDLYIALKRMEEEMRPKRIQQAELLRKITNVVFKF